MKWKSWVAATFLEIRHTIKPGTPECEATENGIPAEQRNTLEQWQNNWTLPGTAAEHYLEQQHNTPEQWNHTKRVQVNKPVKLHPSPKTSENIWSSDNSKEYRSQIIHSNAPMGESSWMHQIWTITLVFSNSRKNVLEWKHALLPFWLLSLWLLCY